MTLSVIQFTHSELKNTELQFTNLNYQILVTLSEINFTNGKGVEEININRFIT